MPAPPADPATPEELFRACYQPTLLHMRELAALYQQKNRWTPGWSPECEPFMIAAIESLKAVCQLISGFQE